MKKDTTIAPPTSAALEQLKEAPHTLTMRREALRQEYQRTCAKLREIYSDVRLHGDPSYEESMHQLRALQAELTALDDQRRNLRQQEQDEFQQASLPCRQALRARYVAELSQYAETLQAAIAPHEAVCKIVEQAREMLGTEHGFPSLHANGHLRPLHAHILKYLAQQDGRR